MNALFYAFYRLFIWPLLITTGRFLSYFQAKIRDGLTLRKPSASGVLPWLDWKKDQLPIWIHCASGEFEYAKPVISSLKERWPKTKIMVTYFSPSISKAVKSFPGIDFSAPAPWDQASVLNRFLDWHRPQLLLIARTDTWPEMLRTASGRKIPTLLFSATLAARSGRARGLGRWVSRAVFSYLQQIYCVSRDDLQMFSDLGFANKTQVMGDTRYDQVIARLKNLRPIRSELFADVGTYLVAGSTWPEDEEVLLPVAARLKNRVRTIIVPHEPTPLHLEKLERKLGELGLKSVRYSTAETWPPESVLLVDQVGILAELYTVGSLAFVGGSFRKTVHSVMEPLAAGCLTFIGPLHKNNREAIEFQNIPLGNSLSCVQAVSGIEDFTQAILQALDLPKESGVRIRREIASRSGKSSYVVDWCAKFLSPPMPIRETATFEPRTN